MMRHVFFISKCAVTLSSVLAAPQQTSPPAEPRPVQPIEGETANAARLTEVASFDACQPTGIAVSRDGRVFVNFPLWSDEHRHAVVEVMPDGATRPYPDELWNSWKAAGDGKLGSAQSISPSKSFVCVQSVWADDKDRLWILDPAAPRMEGIVPGGPKLVSVNLASNQVDRVIAFNDDIAPQGSYLNDVRIDTQRNIAYITESGLGALVVVDLNTGKSRRVLADHPATKAEPDVRLVVQGVELKDPKTGDTPQIHADGIALSKDGDHLYFHALTGKTLYRLPTAALRDASTSESQIAEQLEVLGETGPTDGLIIDEHDNVYHTSLERDAVTRFTPDKKLETVVSDRRLSWPDSLSFGPDGQLYVTCSQIQRMAKFNQGNDTRVDPYRVFKFTVDMQGSPSPLE